ncbi:MAG: TlpA family protein disulfide reductase [Dehalococcoidia bacterium]
MNKSLSITMLIFFSLFLTMCSNNSIDNFKFNIDLYQKDPTIGFTNLIQFSDESVTKDTYIINFWFPSCAPCAKELPHFQKLYKTYKDDIEIIGIQMIGIDNAQDGLEFSENLNLTYKLGYNEDNSTIRKYNINSFPTTIFISKKKDEIIVWDGYISYEDLLIKTKELLN